MPPKLRGARSKALNVNFKKLCDYLSSQKKVAGTINAPDFFESINEVLREKGENLQKVDVRSVSRLVCELENDGLDICSRIDDNIFCTVVEALLQAPDSHEGERGLYLLAVSLNRDDADEGAEELQQRKDAIGKVCLLKLWEYFVDAVKSFGMRRMVGILCLQLIHKSERNIQRIGFEMIESLRRGVGRLVIEEQDEILRTMSGKLISTIVRNGMQLERLFPVHYPSRTYTKFPIADPGEIGWGRRFQAYIDDVYDENPDIVRDLYSNSDFHWANVLKLTPARNFGVSHHKIYIFIDGKQISLWTPSHEGFLDEILYIPLSVIKGLKIMRNEHSQGRTECYLLIEQGNCFLNAKLLPLTQITIFGSESDINVLEESLKCRCKILRADEDSNLIILNSNKLLNQGSQRQLSQASNNSAQVVFDVDEDSTEASEGKDCPGEIKDTYDDNNSNDEVSPIPQSTQGIQMSKGGTKVLKSVIPPRRLQVVKSKAKQPIVPSQPRHLPSVSKGTRYTAPQSPEEPDVYNIISTDDEVDTKTKKRSKAKGKSLPSSNRQNANGKNSVTKKLAAPGVKKMDDNSQATKRRSQRNVKSLLSLQQELGQLEAPAGSRKHRGINDNATNGTTVGTLLKELTPMRKQAVARDQNAFQAQDQASQSSGFAHDYSSNFAEGLEDVTGPTPLASQSVKPDRSKPKSSSEERLQQKRQSAFDMADKLSDILSDLDNQSSGDEYVELKRNAAASVKLNMQKPVDVQRAQDMTDPATCATKEISKESHVKAQSHQESPFLTPSQELPIAHKAQKGAIRVDIEKMQTEEPVSNHTEEPQKGLNNINKRKVILENSLSPKRRRPCENDQPRKASPPAKVTPKAKRRNKSNQNLSPTRRSPRLAARMAKQTPDSMRILDGSLPLSETPRSPPNAFLPPDISTQASNESLPPRVAPLRSAHADSAKRSLKELVSEKTPDTKSLDRKPQVISFSAQGPRNQGISSGVKLDKVSNALLSGVEIDNKKKRRQAEIAELESPPKKRQESSPIGGMGNSSPLVDVSNVRCSPPKASLLDRPRASTRQNSQSSRVDGNGSPIASKPARKTDHLSKLKTKLGFPESEEAIEDVDFEDDYATNCRPQANSEIFGPKIELSLKPKRGANSDDTEERYVLHYKTTDGRYEHPLTEEVIAENKTLDDPFTEQPLSASQFTQRLHSVESLKKKSEDRFQSENLKPSRRLSERIIQRPQRGVTFGQAPNSPQLKQGRGRGKRSDFQPLLDAFSPVDMSDTSYGSQSSQPSKSPLKEKEANEEAYKLAIRPHYSNVRQALHQIADEFIIRLSDEEDRMELLVNQYQENSCKIVQNVVRKREVGKSRIAKELQEKKSEMLSIYSEAREFIEGTASELKETPMSRVEKEWHTKQENIKKAMADVMKGIE